MTNAEHYPQHDRDSCSDESPVNAQAGGSHGCARCTALVMDRAEEAHDLRQFLTGTAMPSLRHILTMIDEGKPITHVRVEVQALLMRTARTV